MIEGAIIGAISAGIGAGIGWLIAKLFVADEPPRWPVVVCAALALALGQQWAREWQKPTVESVLADLEQKEPFFAALREHEPAEYEKVRTVIRRNLANGNVSSVRSEVRQIVLPTILNRVPATSSELLEDFVQLAVDQGEFLAQSHPELCSAWLSGKDRGFDKLLPSEMIKREMALYDGLLRGPKLMSVNVMTEQEASVYLEKILDEIIKDNDITFDQASNALQQIGPNKLQCEVATDLYLNALKLSSDKRDSLLRYLLTNV